LRNREANRTGNAVTPKNGVQELGFLKVRGGESDRDTEVSMNARFTPAGESNSRPFLLLGGALVLMAGLLAFSGSADEEQCVEANGQPTIRDLGGGGGGGAGAFIPGAPLPAGFQNGGGMPDGPSMGAIENVRDSLRLNPINQNNPELYNHPVPVRKPR
jgi:hypothetical protein